MPDLSNTIHPDERRARRRRFWLTVVALLAGLMLGWSLYWHNHEPLLDGYLELPGDLPAGAHLVGVDVGQDGARRPVLVRYVDVVGELEQLRARVAELEVDGSDQADEVTP